MPRRSAQQRLVIVAIVVSFGLTGLTVWAVARQGAALRDRELADLRSAAMQAAAERNASLRGDLERSFIAARLAWQAGRTDGLDMWLKGQRRWSLAVLHTAEVGWTALPMTPDAQSPRFNQQLDGLARRSRVRDVLPAIADALAAARCGTGFQPVAVGPASSRSTGFQPVNPSFPSAGDDIVFATAQPDAEGCWVAAARRLSATAWLGLAAPASDLIDHYWQPATEKSWRVVPAGAEPDEIRLCSLGPPFGNAELVPSAPTVSRLAAQSHRRVILVAVTAIGTVGGWGIVIWMMLRAMARQRELARLQRRFVADVSHELKTPLTMIRLLAETLQDGRVRDPERIRAYYGTITRESERLSVLLDSILDFSRIESGRKRYEFEDCDVAEAARQAWALFEPQFAAEGFDRQLEIAPDLPTIRADAAALQQVMVNLLQNAYRYAGDGRFVRLAVSRDGYVIVITVEDHGIGMTRPQLERLGDSFFRAEDTRVRQTRGTGLGLAIVNHVAQAHGGKLEVHSRPGQGSKFTVWIPFDPKQKNAARD